jgi:hypothetical protein
MLAAIATTIGHRLLVLDLSNRHAATVRARHLASPTVLLEILPGSLLAGKALEELVEADGFRFVGHET